MGGSVQSEAASVKKTMQGGGREGRETGSSFLSSMGSKHQDGSPCLDSPSFPFLPCFCSERSDCVCIQGLPVSCGGEENCAWDGACATGAQSRESTSGPRTEASSGVSRETEAQILGGKSEDRMN